MNVSDWKPVINKGFCITITNKGKTIIPHYTPIHTAEYHNVRRTTEVQSNGVAGIFLGR
jgi:hypothetical protein